MTKPERFAAQKRIKEENRHKILRLLQDKPRTFKELLEQTGFSPMGLTKMLKELKEQNKIGKQDKSRTSPYVLGAGGATTAHELVFLGDTISEVRNNGGRYYIDLSCHVGSEFSDYAPPWGIFAHLFVSKELREKKLNPLWYLEMFDIERVMYEKILQKFEKNKFHLDEDTKGKIIVGFEIDYENLIKSIKSHSPKDHKKYLKEKVKELEQKIEHEKKLEKKAHESTANEIYNKIISVLELTRNATT